jgi:integrase/recombinase XerD
VTAPTQLAERWLASVHASGRSENTLEAYRGDIVQYVRFLDRHGGSDVRDVEQGVVEQFVHEFATAPGRTGRQRADSTVARVVSAVRMFHRWLTEIGITVESAAAGVPPPLAVRSAPPVLDPADLATLLSSIEGDGAIELRDRAVLSLLVVTGIRTAEVVALDLDHVVEDATTLLVPGDRPRPMPIGDPRALRTWLQRGRPLVAEDDPALFPNSRGQRMTRQGVWRIVTARAVDAGLPAGTSPRTLRTTFAATERAAGTTEDELLELLGRTPWTGMAVE